MRINSSGVSASVKQGKNRIKRTLIKRTLRGGVAVGALMLYAQFLSTASQSVEIVRPTSCSVQPPAGATVITPSDVNKISAGDIVRDARGRIVNSGAALSNFDKIFARKSAGTTYYFKAGVYRNFTVEPRDRDSFYGEVTSDCKRLTTLSGANLITKFEKAGGLWKITGQPQEGGITAVVKDRPRVVRGWEGSVYVEDVFINNKPLKHVLSKSQVVPGTFYFDYAADQVFIADNPTGKKVEASATNKAIGSKADNVIIRNLRVEKYSSLMFKGAISIEGSNWRIEDNEVTLNHSTGIGIIKDGNNNIIRRNYVHTNGARGISTYLGEGNLIEENEFAFNNFAKFSYHWDTAGVKLMSNNNIVRRNYIHDNDSRGIWLDIGATNNVLEENLIKANSFSGIDVEVSFRNIVRNNEVGDNGLRKADSYGAQISLHNGQDTKIYGNCIQVAAQYGSGINIGWTRRAYSQAISVDNEVYDNKIAFLGDSGNSGAYSGARDPSIQDEIIRRNKFFKNIYYIAPGSTAKRFVWGRFAYTKSLDLQGAQSIGQEMDSSISLNPKIGESCPKMMSRFSNIR